MKILFVGDYSGVHANLAAELRRRGHKVTVVSDGGLHMQTESDIFVRREPGILGSFRYLYRLFQIQPGLKGFDVVQLVNPGFFGLRPGKLSYFLKHLKNDNGSLFLTLAGNDFFFVEACVRKGMFRFSEFRIGKEKTRQVMCDPECEYGWFNSALTDYTRYLYSQLDGAVSLLPEYDMAARPVLGERLAFAGLPIDFSVLPDLDTEVEGKVRIFVGMVKGREIEKGTDRLLRIAEDMQKEMPERCEAVKVCNLPLRDYLREMAGSHIVLDQLYSYSPGMNGLQAAALGRVYATGAQPEYYEYLGEKDSRPFLCVAPDSEDGLRNQLRRLIMDPEGIAVRGQSCKDFVRRHHDVRVVADRFESHWNNVAGS